jgi:quaternary ammonium compound-resistance protein SugE
MAWITLFIAGIFEIGFAIFLKMSNGFTDLKYTTLCIISTLIGLKLLSTALKTIPISSGYAVWTGIGMLGTSFIGFLFFKDPISVLKILFIMFIITGIVGLKLVS